MRLITVFLASLLLVVATLSSAMSQTAQLVASSDSAGARSKAVGDAEESNAVKTSPAESVPEPAVWVHLRDGRRFQVDDLTEQRDGFWFRRGNISTFLEREKVARVERVAAIKEDALSDPLRGSGGRPRCDD